MFNALLFVPFMMFLFFYPVQALIGLGVVVVTTTPVSTQTVSRPPTEGIPGAGLCQGADCPGGGAGSGAPTAVLTKALSGSAPSISIVPLTTVFGTPVT